MDSSLDRCINSCYPRLVVPWNCERILKITIIIEQWEHYFRKRTFNNIQTKQVYVNYFETFRCCPRKTLGTFDAKVLLTSTHRLPMIRPPDHPRVEVRPLASRPWDSMLLCQEWALGKNTLRNLEQNHIIRFETILKPRIRNYVQVYT